MIEAFRLGIVPQDCVQDFMFGRDKEMEDLQTWLRESAAPVLHLFGEYGVGKTHLLHYLYWTAIRDQFVAALVELDPNEAPLSRPKRVFNKLVQSLRFRRPNGRVAGFREFIAAALSESVLSDHAYFRWLKTYDEDEQVLEWIEAWESSPRPYDLWGKYRALPGLYDNRVSANIYSNLLSGLGHAAIQLGFGGFLLIFDEAESLGQHYYGYERDRGTNFAKGLVRSAREDSGMDQHPVHTGLRYSQHSDVPFLYRRPSGLKLVFAFAGSEYEGVFGELSEATSVYLRALSREAMRAAAESVVRLYQQSYGFDGGKAFKRRDPLERVSRDSTRLHVKALVEVLDLARFSRG
jgi:hypothetical protein